jgi:hypothetical protein
LTFNENCKFLDITKMETDVIKQKTSKGTEKIYRRKHPCLSEKNELDWIYECPKDCRYFEQTG